MNFDFQDEIAQLLPILASGGIVLYPTDTIWGIGCDALNMEAVHRIAQLKQRPPEKSFVLLVDSTEMLEQYVNRIHPRLYSLHEYHQRPVTVVYDKVKNLPEGLVATDGTIAIRIAKDEFCQSLIKQYGKPLIATSANVSNEPFPQIFQEISDVIKLGVDYVVKHRREDNKPSQPSVIVKLGAKEELEFLRE